MRLTSKSSTSFVRLLRKSFFWVLFVFRIHALLRLLRSADTVTVLCFHRISDSVDLAWPSIDRHVFQNIILYLHNRYHIISFDQIDQITNSISNKPLLVISFDDGYLDFKENALPILSKYHIQCNMNVVTNCLENGDLIWTQRVNVILNHLFTSGQSFSFPIRNSFILIDTSKDNIQKIKRTLQKELFSYPYGEIIERLNLVEKELSIPRQDNLMMSWQDLKDCIEKNTEIGSQTMTHRSLYKEIDESVLEQEIVTSKKILEEKTGRPVKIFAYPNGLKNNSAETIAKKAGYEFLLEVNENYYQLPHTPGESGAVKCIPRISIYHNDFHESIMNIEGFHILVRRIKKIFL